MSKKGQTSKTSSTDFHIWPDHKIENIGTNVY